MASTSSRAPETTSTKTTPVKTKNSLALTKTSIGDIVRIALFVAIPIYAWLFLFSSLLTTLRQLYIITTAGICITFISKNGNGNGMNWVWNIVHGLLMSSYPHWARDILRILWIGSTIQGWQWEVVYWMYVARKLAYLLPEKYGSDVEALAKEYGYGHLFFQGPASMICATIVYFSLWPKGCPVYDALFISNIMSSFVEYAYLAYLNYVCLRKTGKTM